MEMVNMLPVNTGNINNYLLIKRTDSLFSVCNHKATEDSRTRPFNSDLVQGSFLHAATAGTVVEPVAAGEGCTTAGSDSYLELALVAEKFYSTLIYFILH